MPWSMLFCIAIRPRVWLVCFEDPLTHRYVRVDGGPYLDYKECFDRMATLRGQVVDGIELK
jgi:hypothetical protein